MELQWGIIGLGKIAHHFANDLMLSPGNKLVAVASRSLEKASLFAIEYGADSAYGEYDTILRDLNVDIIYIATPHHLHASLSIRAMQAGKHVLCEKPAAINAEELTRVLGTAKVTGRFYMEALWSRFIPALTQIIESERHGLGEIRLVEADFGFAAPFDPQSRLFDPQLGGGALLDVGIYPLWLAYTMLGLPADIRAFSRIVNGVDVSTTMLLYMEGGMAVLSCSLESKSKTEAQICGTEGTLYIHERWHEAQSYTIENAITKDRNTKTIPKKGRGYTHEILDVHRAISLGNVESEKWTHNDSLQLITILDRVRAKVGLRYAADR